MTTTRVPVSSTWPDPNPDEPRSLGCSTLLVPPLTVLLVAAALASLALHGPVIAVGASDSHMKEASISAIFTPEIQFWGTSIRGWAKTGNIDADLVAVVMQIESCGNPWANSSAGAIGLFQVMPYHFLESADPYSPDTNAQSALGYLGRSLAAAEGDINLALAGYNGGIGIIAEPESSWPAETQRYAYWGAGIYADAVSGTIPSPRLAEWLAAGGESLCQKAAESIGIEN